MDGGAEGVVTHRYPVGAALGTFVQNSQWNWGRQENRRASDAAICCLAAAPMGTGFQKSPASRIASGSDDERVWSIC